MVAKNENRCWPGYEPVPGKRPNERGSCRKTARSKLTPSGKRVRAARKRQLDRWQEEHPNTRRSASHGLSAPKVKPKKKRSSTTPKRSAMKRKTKSTSTRRPKKTARRSGGGARKRTA